jgi:predicted deacylase
MRDREHERLEEKKKDLTQMLKGNIEALPVINYFSFMLTFRIQSVSHIQII